MNKLDLFSGIGGISLAAHWAGMKTVAFCEKAEFPQKVLRKNWPDAPIYDDVCTLTRERLEQDGIDSRAIRVISAGYPCQPYSSPGLRGGSEDDRALWPEVARLLDEIKPDWFIGENVSGHITLGLDEVLDDLDRLGYTAQPFHIPAFAVDGDHERFRIFIVAHTNRKPGLQNDKTISTIRTKWKSRTDVGGSDWRPIPRVNWDAFRPPVCRGINGISDRVERCRAVGNAVSPQQIYPILAAIKQIDDMIRSEPA